MVADSFSEKSLLLIHQRIVNTFEKWVWTVPEKIMVEYTSKLLWALSLGDVVNNAGHCQVKSSMILLGSEILLDLFTVRWDCVSSSPVTYARHDGCGRVGVWVHN